MRFWKRKGTSGFTGTLLHRPRRCGSTVVAGRYSHFKSDSTSPIEYTQETCQVLEAAFSDARPIPSGLSLSLEKQWFGGRLGGGSFEVGVMGPQRLRKFYFRAGDQPEQLQRIHDSLSLKMIVGDDECRITLLGQMADARSPGLQLLLRVEIVVALRRRHGGIVTEPGVIRPGVEPHVRDSRG